MSAIQQLIQLQSDYEKTHPLSDFHFHDHMIAFGTKQLIKVFKNANGREIVVSYDPCSDDGEFIDYK